MDPQMVVRPPAAHLSDVERALLSFPGVVGVVLGKKVVRGCVTEEPAYIALVRRKRDDLRRQDRIPPRFLGFTTDVLDLATAKHVFDSADPIVSLREFAFVYPGSGGFAVGKVGNEVWTDVVVATGSSYQIGWHIDSFGSPQTDPNYHFDPWSFGADHMWLSDCVGAALADISGNGRQDLVILYQGVYTIGWDIAQLKPVTIPSYVYAEGFWTTGHGVGGSWGDETSGADLAIADISRSGRPDLIVFHIDNADGENVGYYRIGFDMDTRGVIRGGWKEPTPIPGWWGDESADGGIAVYDLRGNGNLDLLVMHLDHAEGGNRGYYRIGWNIDAAGVVETWSDPIPIDGWFGNDTFTASVALEDLTGNGRPDLMVYFVDAGADGPKSYLRVIYNIMADGLPLVR